MKKFNHLHPIIITCIFAIIIAFIIGMHYYLFLQITYSILENNSKCSSAKENFLLYEQLGIKTLENLPKDPKNIEHDKDGCLIMQGEWVDYYTGSLYTSTDQFSVEYIIPIREALKSGANKWTDDEMNDFVSDFDNFILLSKKEAKQRGSKDITKWTPESSPCQYVAKWLELKEKYSLSLDKKEVDRVEDFKKECFYFV